MPKQRNKLSQEELDEQEYQLKRKTLHAQLNKEFQYGKNTITKVEKSWKKLLLSITLPLAREKLKYGWQNFLRILDVKDFVISIILDELDYTEEQRIRSISLHVSNMDKLVDDYNNRLCRLKSEFDYDVQQLKKTQLDFPDWHEEYFGSVEYHMKLIIYALDCLRKPFETYFRGDHKQAVCEALQKHLENLQFTRIVLEERFSKLYDEAKEAIDVYQGTMKQKRENYIQSHKQNIIGKATNRRQLAQMYRKLALINKLKQKFDDIQAFHSTKIGELKFELSYYKEGFSQIKRVMTKQKKREENNLKNLIYKSNELMNYLNRIEAKGKRILQMIQICNKLETQEEKVLPFPIAQPCNREDLENHGDVNDPVKYFGFFWLKISKTHADHVQLVNELKYLLSENKQIQTKIRRFCACVTCPGVPCKQFKNDKVNITCAKRTMKNYNKFTIIK